MTIDYIARALSETVTTHGGAYYDTFQECPRKFQLMHEQLIELKAGSSAQHFEVGKLVHAVLRYAGEAEAEDRLWRDEWEHLLARAESEFGYAGADCEEAARLMSHYFNKWETTNAGYPSDAKIIAVEEEWRAEYGNLPVTARVDTLLNMHDETFIVDHKTRSTKCPSDFVERCKTRPQFLRLAALYRRRSGLNCPIWVNVIVKTKLPSFERHVVRIPDSYLDFWEQNQKTLATRIAYGLREANFSSCAEGWGICPYREYCFGTPEVRDAKYCRKVVSDPKAC